MDIAVVGCRRQPDGGRRRHLHGRPRRPRRGGGPGVAGGSGRLRRCSAPPVDDGRTRRIWPARPAPPAGRSTTNAAPRNTGSRSPACWHVARHKRRSNGRKARRIIMSKLACNDGNQRRSPSNFCASPGGPCSTCCAMSCNSPAPRRVADRATAGRAASPSTAGWSVRLPGAGGRGRRPQGRNHRGHGGWRGIAPAAAEIPRSRGAAVRFLHAGLSRRRQVAVGEKPRPHRDRSSILAGR